MPLPANSPVEQPQHQDHCEENGCEDSRVKQNGDHQRSHRENLQRACRTSLVYPDGSRRRAGYGRSECPAKAGHYVPGHYVPGHYVQPCNGFLFRVGRFVIRLG